MMVPIYSITTLVSMVMYQKSLRFDTMAFVYEPFVISGFFSLLYHYIADDYEEQMLYFEKLTYMYKFASKAPYETGAVHRKRPAARTNQDYDFQNAVPLLWSEEPDTMKEDKEGKKIVVKGEAGVWKRLQKEHEEFENWLTKTRCCCFPSREKKRCCCIEPKDKTRWRCLRKRRWKGFTIDHITQVMIREARDRGGLRKWIFPLSCTLHCCKPFVECFPSLRHKKRECWYADVPMFGDTWYFIQLVAVFQYCFVRVFFTGLAFVAQEQRTYCEDSWSIFHYKFWVCATDWSIYYIPETDEVGHFLGNNIDKYHHALRGSIRIPDCPSTSPAQANVEIGRYQASHIPDLLPRNWHQLRFGLSLGSI